MAVQLFILREVTTRAKPNKDVNIVSIKCQKLTMILKILVLNVGEHLKR